MNVARTNKNNMRDRPYDFNSGYEERYGVRKGSVGYVGRRDKSIKKAVALI